MLPSAVDDKTCRAPQMVNCLPRGAIARRCLPAYRAAQRRRLTHFGSAFLTLRSNLNPNSALRRSGDPHIRLRVGILFPTNLISPTFVRDVCTKRFL
jgi:hypothetical protein